MHVMFHQDQAMPTLVHKIRTLKKNYREVMTHTFSQGRPSSHGCIFLSLFLCFRCFPCKTHSCYLNRAWEDRNMARSRSNSSINGKVQPSSVRCFLKQIFVNSSFILCSRKTQNNNLPITSVSSKEESIEIVDTHKFSFYVSTIVYAYHI